MTDPVTVCGICDIAGCVHTKERQMSDMLIEDLDLARKVLADTGTFETGQAILGEAKARIQDLEAQLAKATEVVEQSGRMRGELKARLEAMTLQHNAALEAVKRARDEALREAAGVAADFVHRMYRTDMPVCSYHAGEAKAAILALINKGTSNGLG